MNQQQHMTKTEAHPYHQGRGCKVFDPNCPTCRDEPKETTYLGWSLHEATLRKLVERFDTLAGAYSQMVGTATDEHARQMRRGQRDAMREAADIARRAIA